jgi:glucokinase
MSDGQRHIDHLPLPALIGDIGGTNARFALVGETSSPIERFLNAKTADHATIDDAIAAALAGHELQPRSAVLALAGPITGDAVQLTNCDWVVEPRKTIARFGLSEMALLNDFEAQSLALAQLHRADFDPIGNGAATEHGARVVLGPGTGLGAGALIHARNMWIPVPGEGGHIDLGPVSDRDFAIWPQLERALGRMSAEALLSGAGMVRLYRGIAATDGRDAPLKTPAEVAGAGLAGDDPLAVETLELFATYLGRLAGDLAMIFMAYGGVYLAGGVAQKIAPGLKTGAFRQAFVDKAPHGELLQQMLTAIVTKEDAALAGITAFARAPHQFGINLEGRHWSP